MRKCEKCNCVCGDNMKFCMNCGEKLSDIIVKQPKQFSFNLFKKFIPFAIVALVLIVVVSVSITDTIGIKNSKESVEDYRLQKILSEPTVYDLKINNYTVDYSSKYTTIEGSVTNTSSNKNINYYEIKVKYYSGDSVEETDWTNGTDLGPGETQSFSIMTKGFWTENDVKLSVEDVN